MAKFYTNLSSGDTVNSILNFGSQYGISISQDLDGQDVDCRKVTATGEVKCTSTTSPFYPPVVSTSQRNSMSGLSQGAMVYDSNLEAICFYDGSEWRRVTHTSA